MPGEGALSDEAPGLLGGVKRCAAVRFRMLSDLAERGRDRLPARIDVADPPREDRVSVMRSVAARQEG